MIIDPQNNTLLVSDIIKDDIPDANEELLTHIKYRFVTAKLDIKNKHQDIIVAGSLVGLSIEEKIKIDFKVKLEIGFDIISGYLYGIEYECNNLHLSYADEETVISRKMRLLSPKIYDVDHENMLCTLALDLV